MKYSLKDILKSLKVLLISKKEKVSNKELDILEMFFHKTITTNAYNKAFKIFSNEHPDVLITDIDIEQGCGIKFCKEIRKINSSIPIIILSEHTNKEYLFEIIRLHVIDFVIRPMKVENMIFALNQTAKYIVKHGEITVSISENVIYNYKEKSVLTREGKEIKLTKNEFRLLELLLANKDITLSKEEIESYLWAKEQITESAFKSLFSRLRQKIGKESIQNSFGIGYQLV